MVTSDKPAPGDHVDNLLYIFANTTVLRKQPRLIRRFDSMDSRYYYCIENGQATFYISTTSFIKKVQPTSPYLIDWMKKQGEAADQIRDEAADFGTLMHIAFAKFHQEGYNFDGTHALVESYVTGLGHRKALIPQWVLRLNKAVASYARFCADYALEPVLIEGMLASDEMGIAGTLDLVAYASVKGERKLVNVDFKSGGIHESAKMQLAINKLIFEENFPDLEIDKCWSWSPNDFRNEPTYKLVDQTRTVYTPHLIDCYLEIYRAHYGSELQSKIFHQFTGKAHPGDPVELFHRAVSIADAVTASYEPIA